MKGWNKRLAALLAVLIVCMTCAAILPIQAQAGTDDGIIRVHLDSISPKSTQTFTINGKYEIKGHGDIELNKGKSYDFTVNSGKIYLGETNLGTTVTLVRCKSDSSVNYLSCSGRNYPGDMLLRLVDGKIDLICTLYMEEYLQGVIGYEMSNGWPLEALKSQAVASRTFAFSSLRPSKAYDVEDTTASQVYKGTQPSYDQVLAAVAATSNQVLTYDGKLSDGYYSASNGGQTNTYSLKWGGKDTYHTVKDDPNDLANKATPSSVFAFAGETALLDGSDVTERMAAALGVPSGAEITGFAYSSLNGLASGRPENSREFKNLTLTVSYKTDSGESKTGEFTVSTSKLKSTFDTSNNMLEYHRIWTYEADANGGFRIIASGYGHGVGMSQRGAQFMANNGYEYKDILDFYYSGCELTTLDYTPPVLPESADGGEETPPPYDQTLPGEKAVVRLESSTSVLYVRSLASSSGVVLARLTHNDEVDVLATEGDWYYIRYNGNSYGFSHSDYIVLKSTIPDEKPSEGTVVAPAVPTGLKAQSAGSNALTLSWNKVEGAAGYRLYLLTTKEDNTQEYILLKDTAEASFSHTGLIAGTSYSYKISAYAQKEDIVQESAQSEAASGKPLPGTSTLTAVSTQVGRATLTWTAVTGASGYELSRKAAGGEYSVVYDGAELAFEDKAEQGATVTYRVRAYTKVGEEKVFGAACEEKTTTIVKETVEVKKQVKLSNASSSLNWRSGPGTNYSKVGSLKHKDVVTLLSVSGSWSQVKKDGTTGYVLSSYLTDVTPDTGNNNDDGGDNKPAEPTTTQKGKVKVSGSLNVRKGPGTGYARVGSLKNGQEVEILSSSGSWYQIKSGSLSGYVSRSYVVLVTEAEGDKDNGDSGNGSTDNGTTPPTQDPPQQTEPQKQAQVKLSNSSSFLNVRKGAGTGYGVITTVKHGTTVTVLETSGSWTKIQLGETVGYVSSQYLQTLSQDSGNKDEGTPDQGSGDSSQKTGTIKVSGSLNVRKSASSSSARVGKLYNGNKVTVLGKSSSWYQIKTDSFTGYVYNKYLVLD